MNAGRRQHKGWRLLQADGVEFVDLAGKLGRGAMHLVCLAARKRSSISSDRRIAACSTVTIPGFHDIFPGSPFR
jgi:hypothetical protein